MWFNADEVQIWTDIDGIHDDPGSVENTSPLQDVVEEAARLAYFSAKILHPLTILPCSRKGNPVILKNTLKPESPGTVLSKATTHQGVKAVAAKDGITPLKSFFADADG